MLALHQELSCDISGWFDFTGLFVLLMELLHTLLSGHHLNKEREREEKSHETTVDQRKDNSLSINRFVVKIQPP